MLHNDNYNSMKQAGRRSDADRIFYEHKHKN